MASARNAGSPRCFAISITPFTSSGAVDEAALGRHLRRLSDGGVGVYVAGGGSGEGYVLSTAEMRTVLKVAVSELGDDAHAMGVEPRTAASMIEFLEVAAEAGVGAAQVYSLDVGHGHRPTEAELAEYFSAVLSSTSLPCVISSHQSVGYRLSLGLLASLAEQFPHVVGVNCSHPDLGYLAGVIDAVSGSGCTVHVGGPGQALACLALGGRGFLSSEANLAPMLCASVGRAYDDGDASAMLERAGQVIRLSNLLYGHGGIRVTKAVLERFGLGGGVPRAPRLPVSEETVDQVVAAVAALGVAELSR
jgi:4-hydroxy-tetrahydrodipicolinate synthase